MENGESTRHGLEQGETEAFAQCCVDIQVSRSINVRHNIVRVAGKGNPADPTPSCQVLQGDITERRLADDKKMYMCTKAFHVSYEKVESLVRAMGTDREEEKGTIGDPQGLTQPCSARGPISIGVHSVRNKHHFRGINSLGYSPLHLNGVPLLNEIKTTVVVWIIRPPVAINDSRSVLLPSDQVCQEGRDLTVADVNDVKGVSFQVASE